MKSGYFSVLAAAACPVLLAAALPLNAITFSTRSVKPNRLVVPIKTWPKPKPASTKGTRRQDVDSVAASPAAIGLGDSDDFLYGVSLNVGGTDIAFHLDTGSADLWAVTDACQTGSCRGATGARYTTSSFVASGQDVELQYGDSNTGTSASGPVGVDTVTLAGMKLDQQPFAAVNFTDNTVVGPGIPTSGIFGLGFPSQSQVQAAAVTAKDGGSLSIDDFVSLTSSMGPFLSRLATTGEVEHPMFTLTLQRNTIDVGGNKGALTIGDLPEGVDNSTLTWVPVRLYPSDVGGLPAPTFAASETYPLRWEVIIDGVYLNGKKLADPSSANGGPVSALIDSGNSILRGPSDVVSSISSALGSSSSDGLTTYRCSSAPTLAFQIGGKMFPVDPRDFVSQHTAGDAQTCDDAKLVSTDPPNTSGQLFSWSLGDPFLKSNLIAFHFGNLTHPSLDPPRMGFLSTVPADAGQRLAQAVENAQANGGNFGSKEDSVPTSALPNGETGVENPTATAPSASATAPSSGAAAPSSSAVVAVTAAPTVPDANPTASSTPSSKANGANMLWLPRMDVAVGCSAVLLAFVL